MYPRSSHRKIPRKARGVFLGVGEARGCRVTGSFEYAEISSVSWRVCLFEGGGGRARRGKLKFASVARGNSRTDRLVVDEKRTK